MIEIPLENDCLYCQLITIQDKPFIFFSTCKEIQVGITCVYPVKFYSIETALKEFLTHTKRIYENR